MRRVFPIHLSRVQSSRLENKGGKRKEGIIEGETTREKEGFFFFFSRRDSDSKGLAKERRGESRVLIP